MTAECSDVLAGPVLDPATGRADRSVTLNPTTTSKGRISTPRVEQLGRGALRGNRDRGRSSGCEGPRRAWRSDPASVPSGTIGGEMRNWIPAAALLVLLGVLESPRPSSAVGGLDNAGCYRFSDTIAPLDAYAPAFSFVDISATGTRLPLGDNQVSAAPIGFTFNFYG